ncbi:ankyrin repeat-containing domain protein [Aspergillus keveii]|uniref:Ankyrin repeat-containing domain protein n=1 Tax=Aspergillus keveii TaxID=714993 RepID=A0ABR4GLN0_9EURO
MSTLLKHLPPELFVLVLDHLRGRDKVRLLRALPLLIPRFPRQAILAIDAEKDADPTRDKSAVRQRSDTTRKKRTSISERRKSKQRRLSAKPRNSLLHLLAEDGELSLLEALFHLHPTLPAASHGHRNTLNRTPVMLACAAGHLAVVQFLADRPDTAPEFALCLRDMNGRNALSWAAGEGHADIVEYLLSRPDISSDVAHNWDPTPRWSTSLLEAVENVADDESSVWHTPLWYAVTGGHASIVQMFVERERAGLLGTWDEVKRSEWRPRRSHRFNERGTVCLLHAIKEGKVDIVRLLLGLTHYNYNMRYVVGRRTMLSLACERGNVEIVRMLLDKDGLKINEEDAYGWTPIVWAAKAGRMEVVQLLRERGAKS